MNSWKIKPRGCLPRHFTPGSDLPILTGDGLFETAPDNSDKGPEKQRPAANKQKKKQVGTAHEKKFILFLNAIAPDMDEFSVTETLKSLRLPLPKFIQIERDDVDGSQLEQFGGGTLLEQLSNLSSYIPFSQDTVSRTSFFDEKQRRGGIYALYSIPEDVELAMQQRGGAVHERVNGQPIRVLPEFECSLAIHVALWKLHKDSINGIISAPEAYGVVLTASSQSPTRKVLTLKAPDLKTIGRIKDQIENVLSFSVFMNPGRNLLFTLYGRRLLMKLSDHMAYLHWDNKTNVLRMFGTKEQQELVEAELVKIVEQLKGLKVDVPLKFQPKFAKNLKQIREDLHKRSGIVDAHLVGRNRFMIPKIWLKFLEYSLLGTRKL